MANPLERMRIRRQIPNHTYGRDVRRQNGRPRPHQGWDLAAPNGTPVYAVAHGTIRQIGEGGAYGIHITLEFLHGGQRLYAFYAHLSAVLCAEGDTVYEGQKIALSGRTGNARGMRGEDEHLHLEIRERLQPGRGMQHRIDPGEVLGYESYSSQP
jgi:murein DD-endopeptidase MepM/ murein hydrolase activator NlpD